MHRAHEIRINLGESRAMGIVMSGIYTIQNTENGKIYVGSTTNFERRWAYHKGDLRKDKHGNPHLQAAWNKYGGGAFEFRVLERLDDLEMLHLAERFWVGICEEASIELYNIAAPGKAPMLGRTHTPEARRKIGKASGERRHNKATRRRISKAARGNQNALGHKLSEEAKRKLKEAATGNKNNNLGRPCSKEQKHKLSEANARPYPAFVHQETSETISAGRGLRALCREHGLSQSSMRAVAAGKQKHHKGWRLMASKRPVAAVGSSRRKTHVERAQDLVRGGSR